MKPIVLILAIIGLTFTAACATPGLSSTQRSTEPTATSGSPVPTAAPQPTATPALTATPATLPSPRTSPTVPPSPSPPATAERSATPSVALAATNTAFPTSPTECPVLPAGGFLSIWQGDAGLQVALGCPTSQHPRITPDAWHVQTAYQPFERGAMIWSDHIGWYAQPVIYVLHGESTYQRVDDTFDPAEDATSGGEQPPNGLLEPILGFGKVWREQPGVRESLGWATAHEAPGEGRFQMFVGGDMVWISQTNQTYVYLAGAGDVLIVNVPFSEP